MADGTITDAREPLRRRLLRLWWPACSYCGKRKLLPGNARSCPEHYDCMMGHGWPVGPRPTDSDGSIGFWQVRR